MRIVVLHSPVSQAATPDELDTLAQVEAVSCALRRLGHEAVPLPCCLNLAEVRQALLDEQPELVFNLVESIESTGRLLHLAGALLDHLAIPYTGSSSAALYLTTHKLVAKEALRLWGLPVPAWITATDLRQEKPPPRGTLIIKSVWEHASVGLEDASVLDPGSAAELEAELERRRRELGGSCFAESYIPGREFNLSLLEGKDGLTCLPPAEMLFEGYPPDKPRLVGYRAKWVEDSFEYQQTKRTFSVSAADQPLLAQLTYLARKSCEAFQVRGYARVDFRVTAAGQPMILEVNANPCLAPDAGFVAAAQQAGISYDTLIERVVDAGRAPYGGGRLRATTHRSTVGGQGITARSARRDSGVRGPIVEWSDGVTADQRPTIEEIVRSTGFFSEAEVEITLELTDAYLEQGTASGYHFLLAREQERVLGFTIFGPIPATHSSYDLYWIVVHRGAQSRGLGKLLLRATEEKIHQLGGEKIYVETSSRPQYHATRMFYETTGYEQATLLEDFYGPGDGKVLLIKRV